MPSRVLKKILLAYRDVQGISKLGILLFRSVDCVYVNREYTRELRLMPACAGIGAMAIVLFSSSLSHHVTVCLICLAACHPALGAGSKLAWRVESLSDKMCR